MKLSHYLGTMLPFPCSLLIYKIHHSLQGSCHWPSISRHPANNVISEMPHHLRPLAPAAAGIPEAGTTSIETSFKIRKKARSPVVTDRLQGPAAQFLALSYLRLTANPPPAVSLRRTGKREAEQKLTLCGLSFIAQFTKLSGSMAESGLLRAYMEKRGSCLVSSNTWNCVLKAERKHSY